MMQLDHYIGRRVKKVHQPKAKEGIPAHEWEIELDGPVFITNLDPARTRPPHEISGKSLQTCVLTYTETRMVFGHIQATGPDEFEPFDQKEVQLTPTQYSIADGDMKEIPQQISEAERTAIALRLAPDDPSPERAVEAPLEAPVDPSEGDDET